MKYTLCVSIHHQVLYDSQYVLHHNGIYHVFSSGQWEAPIITGNRPPPCSDFTINTIPGNGSLIFGDLPTLGFVAISRKLQRNFEE